MYGHYAQKAPNIVTFRTREAARIPREEGHEELAEGIEATLLDADSRRPEPLPVAGHEDLAAGTCSRGLPTTD